MSAARRFITAILTRGDVAEWARLGPIAHLFKNTETDYWAFVDGHVRKHGVLPAPATFEKHTGVELMEAVEPPGYYHELLVDRHIELGLKETVNDAAKFLSPENKKPREALRVIAEGVSKLTVAQNAHAIVDFKTSGSAIMNDLKAKMTGGDEFGLRLGWPYLDAMTGGLHIGDKVSLVGRPALGKAMPLDATVLLANGSFRRLGDIQVGDRLASPDGAPSQVYGVFPQGVRPVYRLTFGDGRQVEADAEHLWKVGCKYWDGPRIMTTMDIIRFREKATRYADTLWVPLFTGEFGGTAPFMDPYLLGVLLGDGGMTQGTPTITTMDPDILERVRAALPRWHVLTLRQPTRQSQADSDAPTSLNSTLWREANAVTTALRQAGLYGSKSEIKFLPPVVFRWSRGDRLALLQGLMDTDGTVDKTGHASFGSSSPALAEGVTRLVRSLGGKAWVRPPKKTTHLPHHLVTVILPERREAFHLSRKREKCRSYTTHDPEHLCIVDVAFVGDKPCQCIAVSHPSRLYIADDYTVTHNTYSLIFNGLKAWGVQKKTVLFISMEIIPLLIMQRLASMYTHIPIDSFKHAQMATTDLNDLKDSLLTIETAGTSFWVIDGNLTASVDDIELFARWFKPDLILIDGAYMLGHMHERDLYRRVGQNANAIKQKICRIAPTVASYQFARKANEKKGDENVTLDDIGYSDIIGQVSSIVLGLFEDESVETAKRRRYRVLKGRSGEIGEFSTFWDFDHMNFEQVVKEDLASLQYT
jgi:replicative DNA helicase